MTASTETPVWFITGCSSGIGRALAERALARGYRCRGHCAQPGLDSDLVAAHPGRALALALDVTDRAQIDDAVGAANARSGASTCS
jgi:NAD(P)-dependent dehydrogenase (short-subunit alcohol dehydrogenase family)